MCINMPNYSYIASTFFAMFLFFPIDVKNVEYM